MGIFVSLLVFLLSILNAVFVSVCLLRANLFECQASRIP